MFIQSNIIVNLLILGSFLTSLISTALWADETLHDSESNNFDGNGYYFPTSKIPEIKSANLQYIQLLTPTAGSTSTKDQSVKVFATYQNRQATKKITYECKNVSLLHGKLSMICTSPLKNNLSIEGSFIDTKGQFWNREDIKPKETVVLHATITLSKSKTRPIDFTYWEGE
jgi:hypothetical protein